MVTQTTVAQIQVMDDAREYMTVREVCTALHISRYSVYVWVQKQWLDGIQLPSGAWRIKRTSVDKALGKTGQAPTSQS